MNMSAAQPQKGEILEKLVAHQRWLRGIEGGKQAKLHFADLSDWTFENINLAKADLTGVCLARANLRNANLQHAILFMADLDHSDLSGANLLGADLRGAIMSRANLNNSHMEGADLSAGALKRSCSTPRGTLKAGKHATDLRNASLENAVLVKANLSDCDLTGANLDSANIEGANFDNAVLVETSFEGVNGAPASGDLHLSYGTDEHIDPAKLLAAHQLFLDSGGQDGALLELRDFTLEDIDFSNKDLRMASFRNCNLKNINFSNSDIDKAVFFESELEDCDFSGSSLGGAGFRKSALKNINFRDAVLGTVTFDSAPDRRIPVSFEGAKLVQVDFTQTKLEQSIFRNTSACILSLKSMREAGVPEIVLRKLTVFQG